MTAHIGTAADQSDVLVWAVIVGVWATSMMVRMALSIWRGP